MAGRTGNNALSNLLESPTRSGDLPMISGMPDTGGNERRPRTTASVAPYGRDIGRLLGRVGSSGRRDLWRGQRFRPRDERGRAGSTNRGPGEPHHRRPRWCRAVTGATALRLGRFVGTSDFGRVLTQLRIGRTIREYSADESPSFLSMPDVPSTDQNAPATSLEVRERLVDALNLDLIGPGAGHTLASERLPGWVRPLELVPDRLPGSGRCAAQAEWRLRRGRRSRRDAGIGRARRGIDGGAQGREEGLLPLVDGLELPRRGGTRTRSA